MQGSHISHNLDQTPEPPLQVHRSQQEPFALDQPSDGDQQLKHSSHQQPVLHSHLLQASYRRLASITVLLPFLGFLVGLGSLLYGSPTPVAISLLISLYVLTMIGVEVGFHRYFSHGAFQTTPAIRAALAILGSMAAQGGVVYWVAHHRRHHQYTDLPGDPHSPHLTGTQPWERLQGLWHAHVGWALEGEITNSMVFAKNLLQDPLIFKINQLHHVWVLLGLVIPTALGGLFTQTWAGAWEGFLWGGLVRIFLGQQMIWSTNSLGHVWGNRPFSTRDRSTNNGWLAIPSLGQSWHNNHHTFQSSAITGLTWWQIDPGAWVIRLLEGVGLAWNVKVPTAEMLKSRSASELH